MFVLLQFLNMNNSKSVGETSCNSCKRQENGDGCTESERPLKKARFAWQVKGKYHLKNELSENRGLNTQEGHTSSENECETSELVGNTEQNLEILGDYLLKQDFNTLDSLTESELTSTSIPSENSYPRYISSTINESLNDNVNENSSSNSDLILDDSKNDIEDQCIARWQIKQMAKCFVDNTINRVLDNWMVTPLPNETIERSRLLAMDVTDFINNLPGDNNSIENEGILMAISAHGLQSNSNSSSSSLNYSAENSISNNELFLLSSNSPTHSEDDNHEPISSRVSSSNEMQVSWISSKDMNQNNDSQLSFFPDGSSLSYQSFNGTENISNGNDCNMSFNDNDMENHFDFMDAAVSFAIQCKGLTSLGTDG